MKRSYRQFCLLAHALDLVGERWTLLIVRDLLLGPQSYGGLLAGLPGIGTNLLARRLKDLTAAGLLEQRPPPRGKRPLYALTARGVALEPAIEALCAWSAGHMGTQDEDELSRPGWFVLALSFKVRSALPHLGAVAEAWELCFPESPETPEDAPMERFTLTLDSQGEGRATCLPRRGRADQPAARLVFPLDVMAEVRAGRRSRAEALAGGQLRIEGPSAGRVRALFGGGR